MPRQEIDWKAVKVYFPPEVLEMVDEAAKLEERNRSSFIRWASHKLAMQIITNKNSTELLAGMVSEDGQEDLIKEFARAMAKETLHEQKQSMRNKVKT